MTGGRQDLVLIPGLLNDRDLWRDQIDTLSDIADCHCPDITRQTTIEAMALDALAGAPGLFALAGFSLGGYVAQEILRQAPHRVTRLALLDTSCVADTAEKTRLRRTTNQAARTPGQFHGFGDRLLASYLAPENLTNEGIASRIRTMTARLGPEVFLRQNGVERKDGRDVLTDLSIPLLVLCGQFDAITPPTDHQMMADLASFSTLLVVPGAGHMAPIEQPHVVSNALRDWLCQAHARSN